MYKNDLNISLTAVNVKSQICSQAVRSSVTDDGMGTPALARPSLSTASSAWTRRDKGQATQQGNVGGRTVGAVHGVSEIYMVTLGAGICGHYGHC